MITKSLELGAGRLLITYATRHLRASDKVRFYYALKGRDGKSGFIAAQGGVFLSKGVLLAPVELRVKWLAFFERWRVPAKTRQLNAVGDSKLKSMASDFCKRHSEVSDAILVSAQTNVVRGKAVFLLVNRANEKLAAEFNKLAGIETYVFPANQLFNPEYKKWLDLLASGTSLVSEKAGSSVLLQYNSSHLKGANKVKFYYALKGRGGSKGILEVTHSEFIGQIPMN